MCSSLFTRRIDELSRYCFFVTSRSNQHRRSSRPRRVILHGALLAALLGRQRRHWWRARDRRHVLRRGCRGRRFVIGHFHAYVGSNFSQIEHLSNVSSNVYNRFSKFHLTCIYLYLLQVVFQFEVQSYLVFSNIQFELNFKLNFVIVISWRNRRRFFKRC